MIAEVNPARAGMIPVSGNSIIIDGSKPRASGDDPVSAWSPHTLAR